MGFLADTLASAPKTPYVWATPATSGTGEGSMPGGGMAQWVPASQIASGGWTPGGQPNSPPPAGGTAVNYMGSVNESSLGLGGPVFQDPATGQYINSGGSIITNASPAQMQSALQGAATAGAQSDAAQAASLTSPAHLAMIAGGAVAGAGLLGYMGGTSAGAASTAGEAASGLSGTVGGMAAPGAVATAGSGVTDEMLLTGQAAASGGTAAGDVATGFSGAGAGAAGAGLPSAYSTGSGLSSLASVASTLGQVGSVAQGLGNLAKGIGGLAAANTLSGNATTAAASADPFASQRAQYDAPLATALANPPAVNLQCELTVCSICKCSYNCGPCVCSIS